MADQKIPVFVITLDTSSDRATSIGTHLECMGIDFEYFVGVNGHGLPDEYIDEITDKTVKLHRGAIGCYLSHTNLYEHMVEKGSEAILVLEDDARVSPVLTNMLRDGLGSYNFDYCFLDCDPKNSLGTVFYDKDDKKIVYKTILSNLLSSGPRTTHAYFITQQAARKRLGNKFPIKEPIDCYDKLPYTPHFRAVVSPKLAWVSEHSLVSLTSDYQNVDGINSLRWLRRNIIFYYVRDLLKMRFIKNWKEKRRLMKAGILSSRKNWRALPAGREVVIQ